jgi:hypothetical protein
LFSADIKVLRESFSVWVFRREGAGKDQPACYRFVLLSKPGTEKALACKSMQARVFENELFFHEIRFVPKDGSPTLERYSEFAVVPRPSDKDFQESLHLPPDVVVKTMLVEGDSDSKK